MFLRTFLIRHKKGSNKNFTVPNVSDFTYVHMSILVKVNVSPIYLLIYLEQEILYVNTNGGAYYLNIDLLLLLLLLFILNFPQH
jgi:hypothetical protein